MKKTLIASAMTLVMVSVTNTNASIAVTSMDFGEVYAGTGSINDDGTMGHLTPSMTFLVNLGRQRKKLL